MQCGEVLDLVRRGPLTRQSPRMFLGLIRWMVVVPTPISNEFEFGAYWTLLPLYVVSRLVPRATKYKISSLSRT